MQDWTDTIEDLNTLVCYILDPNAWAFSIEYLGPLKIEFPQLNLIEWKTKFPNFEKTSTGKKGARLG